MRDDPSNAALLESLVYDVLYGILGTVAIGFGLLLFWAAGSSLLRDPSVSSAVLTLVAGTLSFVFVGTGILVNPWTRRRLNRLHPVTRVGRVRSVDDRVLHPEERCTERCTACDSRVDAGLVRRFREEFVLFGVPLVTRSEEFNHYCRDCATDEPPDVDGHESRDEMGRLEFE
ncbi:hypothetical protein [Haloarchaeobius sp. HRN-SO-5]|uniref:hypothetical protein n=1 Tax=Haloarchaeobius sp. HRN-SO-5 TaxID=3446118 RepID=UPI003EB7ED4C